MSRRSADWWAVAWMLLICLAASIVYGASLRFFFSQDDFVFLTRAVGVASLADFVQLFASSDHFYRPVPRVGFFVAQWRLFGLNAGAFHLVSLGIHCLNALLLFLLCRSLFGSRLLAGLSGFLYATHPLAFLAVYWVSGIQDLSTTAFLLLSLLLYVRFARARGGIYFAGSLAAYGLALLSKEMAATFPGLILLLALVLRGQGTHGPKLRQLIGHTLTYGVVLGLYLLVRGQMTPAFVPSEGPYAWRFGLERVVGRLLEYVHDALYLRSWLGSNSHLATLALILFVAVLAFLFWRSRSHRWVIALGLGWFLLSLLPVLFISQPTYSFYAYFPFAGMAMMMAAPLSALSERILPSPSRASSAQRLVHGTALGLLLLVLLSFSADRVRATESQDPAGIIQKSVVARETITELQERFPSLPAGSTLYVVGLADTDVWAVGHGDLFRLYYPQVNVVLVPEGGDAEALPESNNDAYVYYFGGDR